jgi:hypothetical protein
MNKEYILKILRQRRGLNENDKSQDENIKKMSKDQIFNDICMWNGFIGWDYEIKKWIKDIYKVNLEESKNE